YAGGPKKADTGSGSSLLCLPSNPVFDNLPRTDCGPSTIYGVEYHVCPNSLHYNDVVCAVCRVGGTTFQERFDFMEKTMQFVLELQTECARESGKLDKLQEMLKYFAEMDADRETIVDKRSDDLGAFEAVVDQLTHQVTEMSARISLLENDQTHFTKGAVYVRWGHKTCPNSSETVYSGTMGGPKYTQHGANSLCLPPNPVFDGHALASWSSEIYGSEYELAPQPHHNQDIVCAVCRYAVKEGS
ncbi:hypothetical protein BaRGS_00039763, partial [Batillaria attramentaria]